MVFVPKRIVSAKETIVFVTQTILSDATTVL